ncbi:AfsR/SARP family transcriptional regulator [Saccharothrix coeruleofusca]|uniref:SARP family transcriptional regulator n=1 Tax=Saccharothrix coeruleofusca TaxID=33919 RepID=A0A918EDC6_9PSEU|nr:BTAD domain-containing putative transcriptional regulator [Saccharothrix coeruleofusca]GGP43204.1 SARP family transcriptional regulator [Saccharothrix coeruleofusca]
MEFRVLGPVEARVSGRPVQLGGPKPRTLLAMLLLHAGRVVSLAQLVDAVWGQDPPERTRAAVHTYVSTLRKALSDGAELLTRDAGGYLLAADLDQVDVHVFTREVSAGRVALADGDLEEAAARFAAGLRVWRGPALGGARGEWAEQERGRLEELRLAALEDRVDTDLAMGRGEAVVPELVAAVAEHPLRERLRSQLMLALHQAGRQADALAVYQEGRRVLLDELGLEPGPALRSTHERVLREEPAKPARAEAAPPAPRPSQLPADIADFTGRAAELDQLSRALARPTGAVRVCAISGQAGSGKSTLAAHVAHAVREHFPDGQLYAALHGVHPHRADPAEVLAGFLRALGVPEQGIPADLAERAQLYRTLLADRRVLVVLDDAADERQVRPLLPGEPGCAVLVTSRERLGALSGAAQLDLRVLPDRDALALLDRLVGSDRVAAEPEAAREIVRLCGQLPLAVRIAGARLAARPHWRLARLAERLGVQRRVLGELTLGDLEVRGSLALSYAGLAERERAALRGLGLLDVSGFGGWLVAPLLDCDRDEAEEVVERLVDARLVDVSGEEGGVLRYQVHDLTRAFARERGEAEETPDGVRALCARAARAWLGLVEAAGATPEPDAEPVEVPHLDREVVAELLADPRAWFDAEQAELVGVVERLAELDEAGLATRLATALAASWFSTRNLFHQWWRTHSAALAAARRVGDRADQARLLAGLGWLRYEQDRFGEAESYYEQSLAACQQDGDERGEVTALLELSTVQREQGMLAAARASLDRALLRLRALDEPRLVVSAVHGLSRVLTEQGDLTGALRAGERALAAHRRSGDVRGEALSLRTIGIAHRAAGRLDEAARACERAVELLRGSGERLMTAYAAQSLAKVRIRQGLGDAVRSELLECLGTCNDMQDGFGQALMLRTLGELELSVGRAREALRYLERSLRWWDALRLPVWRARTLRDLAGVHEALGDPARADRAWTEAVEIFTRHGCREAGEPRPASVPVSEVPRAG